MTTPTELPPLLPCPFCGKTRSLRYHTDKTDEMQGTILCDASTANGLHGCGAAGGYAFGEAEAIRSWNMRAALAAAGQRDPRPDPESPPLADPALAAAALAYDREHDGHLGRLRAAIDAAAGQHEAPAGWLPELHELVGRMHQIDRSFDPFGFRDRRIAELAHQALRNALAASPAPQAAAPSAAQPRLTVRVQAFPESNGKRNWTALLVRTDPWGGLIGNCGGITIARGELWNRVAYEAECARALLGERDTEPHILDYGDDIQTPEEWAGEVRGGRSVRPAAAQAAAPEPVALTDEQFLELEKQTPALDDARSEWLHFGRACIAEFCRINGIGSPRADGAGGA